MATIPWETSDGHPITDADGKIIECENCPCPTVTDCATLFALMTGRSLEISFPGTSWNHACCSGLSTPTIIPFAGTPTPDTLLWENPGTPMALCGGDPAESHYYLALALTCFPSNVRALGSIAHSGGTSERWQTGPAFAPNIPYSSFAAGATLTLPLAAVIAADITFCSSFGTGTGTFAFKIL